MHDLLRAAAGRRDRAADARPRSRRARRREPAAVPARSDRRPTRARSRRRDDRRRARARRARRLARLRAVAARRPHSRAVGDGGGREDPRGDAASTSKRCGATMGSSCGFRTWTQPPDPRLLLPDPDEVQALVVRQLGATALFAAKFRENAARSLLLPKRRPGMRAPLWQQRKRAADLLAVAVALRIVPGPARNLSRVPARLLRHAGARRDAGRRPQPEDPRRRRSTRRSRRRLPRRCSSATSPASSTTAMRRWPSGARRRWPSIRRSCASCSATPSCASCSTRTRWTRSSTSCSGSIRSTARRSADGVARHAARASAISTTRRDRARARRRADVADSVDALVARAARAVACAIAGEPRYIAVEDAARYRDALGVPLPPGIPEALLAAGPRSARRPRAALRADARAVHRRRFRRALRPRRAARPKRSSMRLTAEGRLVEGEFRPGGTRREWTDAGVLRMLRRRSLAKLRHEVEPVDQAVLGRFVTTWQGVVEAAARAPTRCSTRSSSCRARRSRRRFSRPRSCRRASTATIPADLDAVMAAGEVVWVGVEPLGERDGRDRAVSRRSPAATAAAGTGPAQAGRTAVDRQTATAADAESDRRRPANSAILEYLRAHGASFFGPLHEAAGGGYPAETVDALWTSRLERARHQRHVSRAARVHAARRASRAHARAAANAVAFRSRRLVPPSAEGRWTLVRPVADAQVRAATRRRTRGPHADAHAVGRGARAATARAPRRAHARGGGGGSDRRRLRRVYPVLKAHGGSRPRAARLLRRRPRRHAVRAAGRARSAALAARRAATSRKSSCWPPPIRPTRTARR